MEVTESTFVSAGNPLQQRRPSVGAGRGKTAAPPSGKENLKGATQQVHHPAPILRIVWHDSSCRLREPMFARRVRLRSVKFRVVCAVAHAQSWARQTQGTSIADCGATFAFDAVSSAQVQAGCNPR